MKKVKWIFSIFFIIFLILIMLTLSSQTLFTSDDSDSIVIKNLNLSSDNSLELGSNHISSGKGTSLNPYLIDNLVIMPNELSTGIVIQEVTKFLKIKNVTIIGGFNGVSLQKSSNIILENVTITNSSWIGIELVGSNNIVIDNVKIKDVGHMGIFADPARFPEKTYGNSITRSVIENTQDTSIMVFGNKTLIEGNKIFDSKWRSIMIISPFTETQITNNYIENSYMEAILAVGFQNTGIVPNIGRSPQNSNHLYITGNEIFNTHEDGIELQEGVLGSKISNNFIHDSPLAISFNEGHMNGIEIWRSSNGNIIEGNVISNMGGLPEHLANGILIALSSHNIITNNEITNVPGAGVMIEWSGNFEMPINNTIFNNTVIDAKPVEIWNRVNDSTDLSSLNTIIP